MTSTVVTTVLLVVVLGRAAGMLGGSVADLVPTVRAATL